MTNKIGEFMSALRNTRRRISNNCRRRSPRRQQSLLLPLLTVVIIIVATIIMIVGCGAVDDMSEPYYAESIASEEVYLTDEIVYDEVEEQEDIAQYEAMFPFELSIPFDRAAEFIAEMEAVFYEDGGKLWGMDFSETPFIFADPVTRHAIANMPVNCDNFIRKDNLYVGVLEYEPFLFIGNTATYYAGERWGIMTWNFTEYLYNADDGASGMMTVPQVMVHESFHRWQPYLFGENETSHERHLYDLFSRVSLQLEINALMHALRSADEKIRLLAINDALSIRAERRNRRPEIVDFENSFEVGEGTALYTDLRLTKGYPDLIMEFLEIYRETISGGTSGLESQSGYIIGALYCLLLDEFSDTWKEEVNWHTDLGALLEETSGISELIPFDEIDLEQYGYSEITVDEAAWLEAYEQMLLEARHVFYETPMLRINHIGDFPMDHFNAERLTVTGIREVRDEGDWVLYFYDDDFAYENFDNFNEFAPTVFYGDFVFIGPFGQLTVRQGHMMMSSCYDRIPAPHIEITGNRVTCHNWVLELNDGFVLEERNGDFWAVRSD
ncbi:MAG: hypothetical protein FWD05_05175 [Oscillospiraceae bacterium]|nr:hypothetical protein [Oscillospiraceae bacterium]